MPAGWIMIWLKLLSFASVSLIFWLCFVYRLKELEEQYRKEKEEADQLFEQQRKVSSACWESQLMHAGSRNWWMVGVNNMS